MYSGSNQIAYELVGNYSSGHTGSGKLRPHYARITVCTQKPTAPIQLQEKDATDIFTNEPKQNTEFWSSLVVSRNGYQICPLQEGKPQREHNEAHQIMKCSAAADRGCYPLAAAQEQRVIPGHLCSCPYDVIGHV